MVTLEMEEHPDKLNEDIDLLFIVISLRVFVSNK